MAVRKPEDNIGGSVGEDFKMEKTPAAHDSRSLLESLSCLEKIRQDACEGRKSKILEQLNLASAFLDFPHSGRHMSLTTNAMQGELGHFLVDCNLGYFTLIM